MTTDVSERQTRERIALLQQRRKAIAGAVWAVAGLVIVFSLGTGTSLLIDHGVWWGIAWMPSVAADVALIVSLLGDQVLADSEIERTPRWGKVLRYVAALVTLGLNTTAAVIGPVIHHYAAGPATDAVQAAARAAVGHGPDWVSVGIHASIVLVLIAATEAAQAYVRAFAPELARLRTELTDLAAAEAAAAERERAEQIAAAERKRAEEAAAIERERTAAAALRAEERAEEEARHLRQVQAQRAAVEAQERASAAARERASAEAELLRQRAAEQAARAEAERLRQERRTRTPQDRRTPETPSPGVRQADVVKAALTHAQTHGELPSESELLTQTGASRSTVTRALREARQTLDQTHAQTHAQTHEQTQGLHLLPTAN